MTLRKNITAFISAACILVLILDSQTALSGAVSGIELCLKSILPSLFPFLFLCTVLTDALWGMKSIFLSFIGGKTGIPKGAESVLIAASLGGYPAGAQAVAAAYSDKKIMRQDAEHLLGFCSNAGPAFLFGIVGSQFENKNMVWALFLIHILAALMTGTLSRRNPSVPTQLHIQGSTIPDILKRSVKTMSVICGWIILFRILAEYLSVWFFCFLPDVVRTLLYGLLELSNGCCHLHLIDDESLRFVICSGMLAFGGLCITMQTASVIGELSVKSYLTGKLLHTFFSLILSVSYLHFGWMSLAGAAGILAAIPKKTVDFQGGKMYNEANISERNQVHAVS